MSNMEEQEAIARQLLVDSAKAARESGHSTALAEICPWCGQTVMLDPEDWFAEKRAHEKDCPQVKEWLKCKE